MIENCKYNYISQLDKAYGTIASSLMGILNGNKTAAESMSSIEALVNQQIANNAIK
jgi:hypothetical protein